ncbi:sensor histidine kinase [Tissierella pigra]|uniref:histidine kinase n=1 Tax=Tissierella pigra TaxID=2607614 RepID=A0A6N7XM12_9FIRM|nr:sensor histidine kinase [Tissierella pigra]MBU5426402.1 sensor histidine kinase [Tissierella pigra]MSU03131.1 sensor histidine kinase [Tissierella pigra]
MKSDSIGIRRLNEILETTINSIKGSKDEIFEIVDYARAECKKLEDELKNIQAKMIEIIEQVENLEDLDKRSRRNLLNKSKNFNLFNEDEIREAYDLANAIRVDLLLKRGEEKNLIEKRKDLEVRLKNSYEVYKKAENVNKQISVATEYLMGNSKDISDTLDELSKKHYLGIKIIEAQEEERLKVARDIHDGPAQSLAHVIVKAELCEKLLNIDQERAKNELNNLKWIIRLTLKDVRRIIYDLRPMSLDDLGLIPTLERYISIFQEEAEIKVNFKPYGKFDDLESAVQVAIFRIIQEALSNIRKHSQAQSSSIIIEKTLNKINLLIIDDGIGFNPESYKEGCNSVSSGFGLMNIKERVELLNGKFNITSSSNVGTKINLFIPLYEEE